MNVALRSAAAEDLPALMRIEKASFAEPHWEAEDFLKYNCTVAECEERVAGFVVSRETPSSNSDLPEREILNLAVDPKYRRAGIASVLLQHVLSAPAISFLEVRESNHAARNLYRKFGFVELGRRPEYYDRPIETAIVLRK